MLESLRADSSMPIQEENFWATTVDSPEVAASPDFPDAVDVAIVGGGYCGLSAARTLAKRGVKPALFEAETFGWGASSRNGGMVLTGMKLPVPKLVKRYGREAVRKMYARLSNRSIASSRLSAKKISTAVSRAAAIWK